MASNVIAFPSHRVTPSVVTGISIEQCLRLEQGFIDAKDWAQAAFFHKAAKILMIEAKFGNTANDNVIPLRRA